MNQSEVARLRAQIELEYQAAKQALEGPAMVGRHAIIEHRFETIGACYDRLEQLMGKLEATKILGETYSQAAEGLPMSTEVVHSDLLKTIDPAFIEETDVDLNGGIDADQ